MALPLQADTKAGAPQALCLVFASTLPLLAILSLVAVLPRMLEHFAGVPQHDWLVPMVLTMPSIVIVLASAPMGWVVDRFGRRRVLVVSLVGFGALGVLPLWLDGLGAILATRLVVGLAEAGIVTTVNALMGDYFEGAERERWLGRQMMLGPLLGSLYVLAGGALGSIDWRMPFLMYLVALPVLAAVLVLLREPGAARPQADAGPRTAFPWQACLRVGAVTLLLALFFFLQLVQHGRIFAALGVESPGAIGLFVTAVGMAAIVGGTVYPRLRGWGVARKLSLVLALYAVGYLGLGLAPNLVVGTVFDAITVGAGGLAIPTLTSWALGHYDFEHRGRGMGAWNAFFSLGQFVSPAVAGLIGAGIGGFMPALRVFGVFAALAAVVSWQVSRRAIR